MCAASVLVLPTPEEVGAYVGRRILQRVETTRIAGRRFLLGHPTGRTPKPILAAMAEQLRTAPQDLSHVTLVMMDEYLVAAGDGRLKHAPPDASWSCHHFVELEILRQLNAVLPRAFRVHKDKVWFPVVDDPEEYDRRIAGAGGIDLFLLASGASDGHVAFNPPGSARDSRTRVVPLSDETRRDNLLTFPAFGTLNAVPRYGVSVGIATIMSARGAIMVVWGRGKRETLARMRGTDRYDPVWPATLIHECAHAEIVADQDASGC